MRLNWLIIQFSLFKSPIKKLLEQLKLSTGTLNFPEFLKSTSGKGDAGYLPLVLF